MTVLLKRPQVPPFADQWRGLIIARRFRPVVLRAPTINPFLGEALTLMVFISGAAALLSTAIGAWRGEQSRAAASEHALSPSRSGGLDVRRRERRRQAGWFWTERAYFEQATREAAHGEVPSCVATKRCIRARASTTGVAFPERRHMLTTGTA